MRFYPGCTGLKTGTTSKAGHCLSASATRDNMQLVSVIMGADNSDNRFGGARKLLDHGFANYENSSITADAEELGQVKVTGGTKPGVNIAPPAPLPVLVPKGQADKITRTVSLPESIEAPVKKGQLIGSVTIELEGTVLGEIAFCAADDVPEMTFLAALSRLLGALFSL